MLNDDFILFLQDSESLRERMLTIETQLKKLQQCLNSSVALTASSSAAGIIIATLTSGRHARPHYRKRSANTLRFPTYLCQKGDLETDLGTAVF